jgi:AraC-like DNA-binding protein
VISVAQQVGFFDQSHLNKAFKRAFLLSPQAFQRRML